MQQVSDQFLEAMTGDQLHIYCRAETYAGVNGVQTGSFRVIDGSVQLDVSNAARRQLPGLTMATTDDSVPGQSLIPTKAGDALFPDGTEVMVWKGAQYSSDPTDHEEVPLGRFLVEEADVSHQGGQIEISLTGLDRAETVRRSGFSSPFTAATLVGAAATYGPTDTVLQVGPGAPAGVYPYTLYSASGEQMTVTGAVDAGVFDTFYLSVQRGANGTTATSGSQGTWLWVHAETTIQAILDKAVGGLQYNFAPTGALIAPISFNIGDDPMAGAMAAAAAAAADLFFDPVGVPTLLPIVDPATIAPAATFAGGPDSILLSTLNKKINTAVPNVIVVVSQGSSVTTPLTAMWWDSDPTSFSFYGYFPPPARPLGEYPTTVQQITTTVATTQGQVNAMAKAAGLAAKNTFDTITVTLRDFPPLDGIDTMQIADPQARIFGLYTVDQITYPLGTGANMPVTGRKVSA